MSFFRAFLFAAALAGAGLGFGRSFAQPEVAPELRDRPPVAAPTSKIEVGAIPVVLSDSQEADNFATGLLQGLMAGARVKGIALIAVKDDHVMFQRNIGVAGPETRIGLGDLANVFDAVAAMQLIERKKLTADEDIGKALGETNARGVTLAQMLTRQGGDPTLLVRAVEKASGAPMADYVAKEIAQPLSMSATAFRGGNFQTTLADMSHLAIALVNGGAFGSGRILEPASLDLMESTHFTLHPALPGWAYGFAEMRRNGWRALQHEGLAGDFASRLVVVPDARIAYFIVVDGRAGAEFWRALDDGLFDKLLAMRGITGTTASASPAPGAAQARRVAGLYQPVRDAAASAAALKLGNFRLAVRAANDGSLVLTGAQDATLTPRAGGYWGSGDGNLNAVARDGRLVLSTGAYGPLALYARPALYAWLALLAALAAGGVVHYERRRKPQTIFPSDPVLGLASASVVFLLLSALVWLLAPVV